jgi:hypothetical protein
MPTDEEEEEKTRPNVSRAAMAESERQLERLRPELLEEGRTAKSLGAVSVVLNVVSIIAIVGLARGKLGLLTGVVVAAVEFFVVSVVWAAARSGRPHSFSLIRLP